MTRDFLLVVHGCQLSMTMVTTSFILGVAVALDPPIYAEIIYNFLQVQQTLSNL